ncbi:hypothetical protein FS842_005542 [Serendipita sp. 407]|nr:hypothetical protein FS842_005542 [Serendipita sp. 407]
MPPVLSMEEPIDIAVTIRELQNEFCPPLDESLFLALCGDLEATKAAIDALRVTLSTLAADALAISISTSDILGLGDPNDCSSNSALPSTTSSHSSETTSSALQFLRAAFPDLQLHLLQDAIEDASNEGGIVEMEKIVEELLSAELLTDQDEFILDSPTVGSQPETRGKAAKRKKTKVQKIIIGDVRQRPLSSSPNQVVASDRIDPWTQLSSLADYLSTLLPTSSSTLLSLFHSPDYPTTFAALSSYLDSLPACKCSEEELDTALISMNDILGADDFNAQWAEKCLRSTDCRVSDALDLYVALQRLDESGPITHAKAPSIKSEGKSISSPFNASHPNTPSDPKRSFSTPLSPTTAKRRSSKPNPEGWQVVDRQSPRTPNAHPHADYIPAYRNLKVNRAIEESWRERRIEALRKASHHWQRSQDGHGRQIAAYYADEANKYLKESREAAVEAARALVVRNRDRNKGLGYNTERSIDLHGMTREEALVIVRETLVAQTQQMRGTQWDAPLRFITGKGNHSAGKQSILLPAIAKMLRSEGWKIREIEAGVAVYGKV